MEREELLEQVASVPNWYHVIDLGQGVVTPGAIDMAPYVEHYGLPERLDGRRVLDVGAANGFFSFELERRGATVVALDLARWEDHDWTPRYRAELHRRHDEAERALGDDLLQRRGFAVAREALGSSVEKVELPVYEIAPERLGSFDLVFCGSMLMHVRDPILALQRMRSVCRGEIVAASSTWRVDEPEPLARFRRRVGPVQLVADEPGLPAGGPRERRLRGDRAPPDLHDHRRRGALRGSPGGRARAGAGPRRVCERRGLSVHCRRTPGGAPGQNLQSTSTWDRLRPCVGPPGP